MPAPPSPRPLAVALRTLAVCGVLGGAGWLTSDVPRRLASGALADRLAAEVRLERLEVLGADFFVLHGLEIAEVRDLPFVECVRVAELEVYGSLSDLADGRYRRLRVAGASLRLAPAPGASAPDRPLPSIGELILEPAEVRIAGGGGESQLSIEATLRGLGSRPSGRARLRSRDLAIESLTALTGGERPPRVAGRARDLSIVLRLGPRASELTADAGDLELALAGGVLALVEPRLVAAPAGPDLRIGLAADRAEVIRAGETATAEAPRIEAAVTPPAEGAGPWRFEVRPRLDWLEGGALAGDWDAAGSRLLRLEGRLEGLALGRLAAGSGLDAVADLELRGAGDRLAWSAEVTPRRVAAAAGYLRPAAGSKLSASGSLAFAPLAALEAPVFEGPIEATLALPGAAGRWGEASLPASLFPLTARFRGRWRGLEAPSLEGDARFDVPLAGRLETSGTLAGGDEARFDLAWTWTGGRLERLAEELQRGGLPVPASLAGDVAGRGSLRGPWSGPAWRAELRLGRVAAAFSGPDAPAFRLADGSATADVVRDGRGPVRLRSLEAAGTLEVPGLRPLPVSVTDAAGWSAADGVRGELERATLASPGLGTARVAGAWRAEAGGVAVAAELALSGLDVAAWQAAVEPPARAISGFELAGIAGAELQLSLDPDGGWRLDGPVRLESAGFAADDGSRVMEGLEGAFDLAVESAPEGPIAVMADGSVGGFVLLWETFFGDFSDVEATLALRSRRGPATAEDLRPWRLEVGAALPGGPEAEAGVESSGAAGAALAYTLSVQDGDLAATHERYLAPLGAGPLAGLELGGALSARGRGHFRAAEGGPSDWSLIGAVKLAGFRLGSGGGQAAVAGLDLELPLDLRRRPTPEPAFSGPRLGGRLAFERLAVRGLELPPTETDLWVEADSVGLEKPVALAVLGGAVNLERLTAKHLLRAGRHLEAGLELSGLRLERIAEELGLFPLEGALDGRFPVVRLSPEALEVEGGGRVEVFGGTVELRDVSGEDVLSRYPEVTFSADFRDLDLGALTRRIDFGEMTGILEGSVEDCRLFRGVPVRFRATLQTAEREGVPRTIDVKAINNLTILGTGAGTSIFDRGIRRLLDRYRYERLGVTLELGNDVLLLRGLERRGGKELFLRGRLPFRIDVVNAQPGRTVSFQAMVRRLKSLDFARATTER